MVRHAQRWRGRARSARGGQGRAVRPEVPEGGKASEAWAPHASRRRWIRRRLRAKVLRMRKKVELGRQSSGAERPRSAGARRARADMQRPAAGKSSTPAPAAAPVEGEPCTKIRCKGATRNGDPCRFWALSDSEFCYWCEQAGRPRYPLPRPTGEAARAASIKEIHKKRCQGVTVFGDQCRFWAVGSADYCLWCSASKNEKSGTRVTAPVPLLPPLRTQG
jgi:hypothetical protein